MCKEKVNFKDLYELQIAYQTLILQSKKGAFCESIPCDNKEWFSYHMQAMLEELGEVLKADKRWKTHRNENYNQFEKMQELADVFITAMNLAIYSGLQAEEIISMIHWKINENSLKLIEEVKGQSNG